MKQLIIAANLGRIRVLKFREAGEDPIEQEHLIEETAESGKEHVSSMSESVTDQSGRFGRGTPVGFETGMSYGEEHHLKDEMERCAMKKIAYRITEVLQREGSPPWILAAPSSILARLKTMLPAAARDSLASSVAADLTRCPLLEMEQRFLEERRFTLDHPA